MFLKAINKERLIPIHRLLLNFYHITICIRKKFLFSFSNWDIYHDHYYIESSKYQRTYLTRPHHLLLRQVFRIFQGFLRNFQE